MEKPWLNPLWILIVRLRPLWISIVGIVLIGVYSYFRSVAINDTFISVLDKIILVIITELWKFISTPTVFISILAVTLILSFQENIRSNFPNLSEVSAAGVSLKFEKSENQAVQIKIDQNHTADSLAIAQAAMPDFVGNLGMAFANEQTYIDSLISVLGSKTMQFLLDIEDQTLTTEQVVQFLDKAELFSKWIKSDNEESRRLYYFGVFRAMYALIMVHLYEITVTEDNKMAHFAFKASVKDKIVNKLQTLLNIKKKADIGIKEKS